VTPPGKVPHVVIIGGGFCGLAAGYELTRHGVRVTIFEQDSDIGGLGGSFPVNGVCLEKFYHHWFNHDKELMGLIQELGTQDRLILRPTRTGIYYANQIFRLSTPLDVIRFKPLSVLDRVRLGLLALRARGVKNWRPLEDLTAEEWLRRMAGDRVYEVIWEPLLRGKFGDYAPEVSAVWMWNKLRLRGGSRSKAGEEQLAYYRGGLAALTDQIASRIRECGGRIVTNAPVEALIVEQGRVTGVKVTGERVGADAVIATPALPVIADLVEPHAEPEYVARLRRIRYLANVCILLELERSLSDLYWLNVNDPAFPFVAAIEHTNFEPAETYGGRHICYLSTYLPESGEPFQMEDGALLESTIPHLERLYPHFERLWIVDYHVWRARFAQPVVERRYRDLIPASETPLSGLHLATMAQIYPEDRGTNYAIREGRRVGGQVAHALERRAWPASTITELNPPKPASDSRRDWIRERSFS